MLRIGNSTVMWYPNTPERQVVIDAYQIIAMGFYASFMDAHQRGRRGQMYFTE